MNERFEAVITARVSHLATEDLAHAVNSAAADLMVAAAEFPGFTGDLQVGVEVLRYDADDLDADHVVVWPTTG